LVASSSGSRTVKFFAMVACYRCTKPSRSPIHNRRTLTAGKARPNVEVDEVAASPS